MTAIGGVVRNLLRSSVAIRHVIAGITSLILGIGHLSLYGVRATCCAVDAVWTCDGAPRPDGLRTALRTRLTEHLFGWRLGRMQFG